jgi:hypothetical protein
MRCLPKVFDGDLCGVLRSPSSLEKLGLKTLRRAHRLCAVTTVCRRACSIHRELKFQSKVIISQIKNCAEGKMPVSLINARGLSDVAHGLTIMALIICFLYFAGVIVQPLAIGALLSFILAPVMRHLRIWGVPKIVSALFFQ